MAGFGFKSIGHFFAAVANDIVKVSKYVAHAASVAQDNAPLVEALTSLVSPAAADIERGAFAVLGVVAQAVHSAGDAAAANGINVALDAQLVADIKAIIPAIEAFAKAQGVQKPAA